MKLKIIIPFLIFISPLAYSHLDTLSLSQTEIELLVDKIGVKLLLGDNQKLELTKILSKYSSEIAELRTQGNYTFDNRNKLLSDLDSEILKLFDSKQKLKYEIIKDDWLESLKSEEND
jgi:predicted  nucleic acid-binding Zn-ribbon protein